MLYKIARNERKKNQIREGALNFLFGIKSYVKLDSKPKKLLNENVTPLDDVVSEFLGEDNKNEVLIIEGKSGSGKSLFLIEYLSRFIMKII